MGGFFDREQSMSPQIAGGFGFMPGLAEDLYRRGTANYTGDYTAGIGADEQSFLAGINALDIPGLIGSGVSNLMNIAQGGAVDAFLPGMRRLFDLGNANVREQSAMLGGLSGSGTEQNIADFTQNVVGDVAQRVAPIQAQAAQTLFQGLPGLASLGQQAAGGLERSIQDTGLTRALQMAQFSQGLVPQMMQGLGAMASGTPMFQPTTGPSKFESMLGTVAPVAGAYLGGKGGGPSASGLGWTENSQQQSFLQGLQRPR